MLGVFEVEPEVIAPQAHRNRLLLFFRNVDGYFRSGFLWWGSALGVVYVRVQLDQIFRQSHFNDFWFIECHLSLPPFFKMYLSLMSSERLLYTQLL